METISDSIKTFWDNFPFEEMAQAAQADFERRITANQIVLTGELYKSLSTDVRVAAAELYSEMSIKFAPHGRFQDMKRIKIANISRKMIEGLEHFVAKTGLQNFKYTPGYNNNSPALANMTTSMQINRIAWGVAISRRSVGTIKRKNDGWYNKGKSKVLAEYKTQLSQKIISLLLSRLADGLAQPIQ